MKNLSKVLVVMVFFSLAGAFFAYAEEMKTPENVPAALSKPLPAGQTVPAQVEKTTLNNLQAAFINASNANARYLAFAQKADAEERGKSASLFRAIARAKQIQLERYAKVIKDLGGVVPEAKIATPVVKSNTENLEETSGRETRDSLVVYTAFLAQAEKDNMRAAADAFEYAKKTALAYGFISKKTLWQLTGKKSEDTDTDKGPEVLAKEKSKKLDFYVCPVCGKVSSKTLFKKEACPICGESKEKFITVN